MGVDLPPFYSAALLSRPNGPALLIGGVDGKVQVVDNGALKPVSGARDWGSDFALLKSGCGSGAQVIASGSGEAANDSLRAYEIMDREPAPVGAATQFNGALTALWSKDDGSAVAVERNLDTGKYAAYSVAVACHQ